MNESKKSTEYENIRFRAIAMILHRDG